MRFLAWSIALVLITLPHAVPAAPNRHATLEPAAAAAFQQLSAKAKRGDFGPDVQDAKVVVHTNSIRIDFVHKDGAERGFLLLPPRVNIGGTQRNFTVSADPEVSDDDVRRLAGALDELFPVSPWLMAEDRTPTATSASVASSSDARGFFAKAGDCWQGEFGHCLVIGVIEPMITQQAGRGYAAFVIALIVLAVVGGVGLLWTARPEDAP